AVSFTRSSKKHFPFFLQAIQATQPRMALFPTWTVSVSMPSSRKIFSISLKAMAVFPPRLGLPLSSSTFTAFPPLSVLPVHVRHHFHIAPEHLRGTGVVAGVLVQGGDFRHFLLRQ